jgi:prevent-host-death family protein
MRIISCTEAKIRFSKLIDSVMHGDEIIITLDERPVARLSPIKRRFGVLKGKIKISKNFDEPLPEETLKEFDE